MHSIAIGRGDNFSPLDATDRRSILNPDRICAENGTISTQNDSVNGEREGVHPALKFKTTGCANPAKEATLHS